MAYLTIQIKQTEAIMENNNGELQLVADKATYDPNDVKSLQQMFPGNSLIPDRITELAGEIDMGRSDDSFKKLLHNHEDYKTARRLRMQFWNTYNNYIDSENKKTVHITAIYGGIVTKGKFQRILESDQLASFIFTQPLNLTLIQEDLLYEGYRQMEEIMEAPIFKADGTADARIIAHKLKIISMLEDRINGSVVQRSQSYVETASKFEKGHGETPEELADIKKKVLELRKALGKPKQEPEEVSYVEVK